VCAVQLPSRYLINPLDEIAWSRSPRSAPAISDTTASANMMSTAELGGRVHEWT
jgi:hypothetical protein